MKKLLTLLITSCILCAGAVVSADTVKENDIQLLTDLGVVGSEIKSGLSQPNTIKLRKITKFRNEAWLFF